MGLIKKFYGRFQIYDPDSPDISRSFLPQMQGTGRKAVATLPRPDCNAAGEVKNFARRVTICMFKNILIFNVTICDDNAFCVITQKVMKFSG